jgi:sterol desaturase/sphingolipid hydroxylase (fatty acid hydroxylase superfamily)
MSPHLVQEAQAFALQVARITVWLVLLTAIFVPLERLFSLHKKPDRLKDVPGDLAFYVLNSLLPIVLLAPPLAVLAAGLRLVIPQAYTDAVATLPFVARLLLAMAVSEVGGYWGHRWSHEIPFLWRFHAIHHAREHVDWLISSRAHPVDFVFTRICALTPLYILGLVQPTPQGSLLAAWVTIFGTIWGFFVHANVRWRFGPLEWLISTPAFHHWHHTNDEHRDHNYAALFPIVDWIFGTFHLPNRWPDRYGVDHPPRPAMLDQLLDPFSPPPTTTTTPPASR